MIRGAKGGFIATVLMTVYRIPMFRALPPTSELWAQFVGGGPAEEYPVAGYVLHALYGTVAGAVLGGVLPSVERRSPVGAETTALFSGVGFSVLLSLFGVHVLFHRLLGRELEPDQEVVFHVGHVVYGLTLGTWLGRSERVGEVYDSPSEASPRPGAPARPDGGERRDAAR